MQACIFDLDGVLCDTAKYHFLAWKRLADELGIVFTEEDNERLKGVSRMQSLDILLSLGTAAYTPQQKDDMAAKKNAWYVEYITHMDKTELLPGVEEFILALKAEGIKIALGSVSKNAPVILQRLQIEQLFDAVVDGNSVTKAKPDPEVFLLGASLLGVEPAQCVVFEDAVAGLQAAHTAGMACVGVGNPETLQGAQWVIQSFVGLTPQILAAKI